MHKAIKLLSVFAFACSWWTVGLKAQESELRSDLARRDFAIRWPAGYEPSIAPVFSHNQLLIHADCHRVFARLADAVDWPKWFVLVKDVTNETPGNSSQGALYRLRIFDSPIQSRIAEFVPDERISWIPFGSDETETLHGHYHAWHLIRKAGNCLVITEETGIGPEDFKDPVHGSHLMHKAHELWLASLKVTSEP